MSADATRQAVEFSDETSLCELEPSARRLRRGQRGRPGRGRGCDPQAGFDYAKGVCSKCHGISAEKSPLAKATRFREVADRPGINGTALRVWLETSHPTMPNIVVEPQDMRNVVAYILSLKGRDAASGH